MSSHSPLDSVLHTFCGGGFRREGVDGRDPDSDCESNGLGAGGECLSGRQKERHARHAHVCGIRGPARWWVGSVLGIAKELEWGEEVG